MEPRGYGNLGKNFPRDNEPYKIDDPDNSDTLESGLEGMAETSKLVAQMLSTMRTELIKNGWSEQSAEDTARQHQTFLYQALIMDRQSELFG